jgi:hypothetical protein
VKSLITLMDPDEWRRSIALVILWAYAYQLIVWPLWFNGSVIFSAIFGVNIPAPVLLPWEQLIAGTTTLGTVGGIQIWRDKLNATQDAPKL